MPIIQSKLGVHKQLFYNVLNAYTTQFKATLFIFILLMSCEHCIQE